MVSLPPIISAAEFHDFQPKNVCSTRWTADSFRKRCRLLPPEVSFAGRTFLIIAIWLQSVYFKYYVIVITSSTCLSVSDYHASVDHMSPNIEFALFSSRRRSTFDLLAFEVVNDGVRVFLFEVAFWGSGIQIQVGRFAHQG